MTERDRRERSAFFIDVRQSEALTQPIRSRRLLRTFFKEWFAGGEPDAKKGRGTGIRIWNVASAYEHSGYSPDEIVEFYPTLSLSDVHAALAYYYDHIDEFRNHDGADPAERPA